MKVFPLAATVQIDHAVTNGNVVGIFLTGTAAHNVSNGTASNNSAQGFVFSSSSVTMADSLIAYGNQTGISMNVGTVLIGRSVISGNGIGISASASGNFSYRNNQINGNGTDVSGTLTTANAQ